MSTTITTRRPPAILAALALGSLAVACRPDEPAPLPPLPTVPLAESPLVRPTPDPAAAEVRVRILVPVDGGMFKAASAPAIRATVASFLPETENPSTDVVDPTTVRAVLRRAADGVVAAEGLLFGPMGGGEFAGRLDLTTVPTGDYLLNVAATTRAGRTGAATARLKIDAGPRITLLSPREGGAYKGSAAIQVLIDASPFELDLASVEAVVGNKPVALTPAAGDAGSYVGTIEFDRYDPPLVGEQALRVSAQNKEGTRADLRVRFLVDAQGPSLTDTHPMEGSVVGGVVRLSARLVDPAGILGPSVIAVIGNKADVNFKVELRPEPGDAGLYTGVFDTARLTVCKRPEDLCVIWPNLSFRGADRLGNETTVAYDIAVDNHPPVADLDPPDMRIWKLDRMTKRTVCSRAFDPVGPYRRLGDMPNDGCAAPQVFDLRARIEDAGNFGDGLKVVPIAGIDPATTGVYVLDDTTQPLVVDVDGDGVCDRINPKLVPTTQPPAKPGEVLLTRLVPVPVKGEPDFTPDMTASGWAGCGSGAEMQSPLPLCSAQAIPIAIGYSVAKDPKSAIWTIEPLTEKEHFCLGSQFDAHANEIEDGWACIAAAASDRNGNAGVSRPLRVWIQRRGLSSTGICPAPPANAGPAPDCTGTYDRASATVSPQACRARRFAEREVRALGE